MLRRPPRLGLAWPGLASVRGRDITSLILHVDDDVVLVSILALALHNAPKSRHVVSLGCASNGKYIVFYHNELIALIIRRTSLPALCLRPCGLKMVDVT